MKDVLNRLYENSRAAIADGVYDVQCSLRQSRTDLVREINESQHASILAEIKFASPSLGKIRGHQDPATIASQMVAGGAKALSILTQPKLFHGSPDYLIAVRNAVDVPLLMKDVMVDTVQVDAAKSMGADYILAIQSLYDAGYLDGLDEFIAYGHEKRLKVILEVHTESEMRNALDTDADIIGINNRNLDTLEIDLHTTERLLAGVKDDRPIISESGVDTPSDIRYLSRCGADAFLVGSGIMKEQDVRQRTSELVMAI